MNTVIFSDEIKELLRKLKKKDNMLLERINKAVKEISQNPEHYKPLRNILKGKRRKQIGHFVLIFSFKDGIIYMENFAHHDNIYWRTIMMHTGQLNRKGYNATAFAKNVKWRFKWFEKEINKGEINDRQT